MSDERTYHVQFLLVEEISVTTLDDLQAEREAYQKLAMHKCGSAIAIRVLNRTEPDGDEDLGEAGLGGALAYEDNTENWKLAREAFDALDKDWVE